MWEYLIVHEPYLWYVISSPESVNSNPNLVGSSRWSHSFQVRVTPNRLFGSGTKGPNPKQGTFIVSPGG